MDGSSAGPSDHLRQQGGVVFCYSWSRTIRVSNRNTTRGRANHARQIRAQRCWRPKDPSLPWGFPVRKGSGGCPDHTRAGRRDSKANRLSQRSGGGALHPPLDPRFDLDGLAHGFPCSLLLLAYAHAVSPLASNSAAYELKSLPPALSASRSSL